MNTFNNLKYSILILCIAIVGFGCSTNSSNDDTATINGSVQEQSSQQKVTNQYVEEAVVTAARVTSEGSIETIDGVKTETDASGEFTLNVDVESAQNIVIIAEKEGTTWSGYLSGHVENGGSFILKPLNTESSAETDVFMQLVASGNADIVQKSDVETVVTSQMATEIRSDASAASRIAVALKNAAEARANYYAETLGSSAESRLEATFEAMADAQFQLESELAASTSSEQRTEAYEVFIQSTINAYINAGLETSSSAKVIEMWSRVFVNSLTAISTDIKEQSRMNASLVAAAAIDLAVQAQAEASGMSESSQEAIVEAGVQLRSAIRASIGVASEVKAAFEAYHDEVKSTMENDSSYEATAIIQIDSQINASTGPKTTFKSSIATALDASVVFDIYQSYYNTIKTTVETSLTGHSESEIEAASQIMILINLMS